MNKNDALSPTPAYQAKPLVCRTVGERHELWGLAAQGDARFFGFMGTTSRPQDFRNRVVVSGE